jgi:hypothetical protein
MILTGLLMGLVAIFTITLCYLTLPPLLQWIRRKIPVSDARVQRRYETVEGWLIVVIGKVFFAATGTTT